MGLSHLFSPILINKMELKNRAVMPPMATGYPGQDGEVTEVLVEYLACRARGGAGLIIVEPCAVDPRGKGITNMFGLWTDDSISSLTRIPAAIHREGGKAAIQLQHSGREASKEVTGYMPEAPSPVISPSRCQPCQEMSRERIAQVVQAFAGAAGRAQETGFDAVELHGAHGNLINQFLSPFSNKREDDYGGSDENRARFALEIIRAVRRRVGPDFPVLIRLSGEELVPGGYDLKFITWLSPRLVEAGVDAIHVSVAVYSNPSQPFVASMDADPGFNLFRARAVKEVVDEPVIGVGRINDPRQADEAIARGDADLISFGRQHLADPDFIRKAQAGNFDDIRWCLACNQGCIDRLVEGKAVTCSINPECGYEGQATMGKVVRPKKVWVIGAGPAGMSAAMAAAGRGHQVEIFEKEAEPGGQLRPASRPPHKEVFAMWTSWAVRQLEKSNVKLNLGCEVTGDMIRAGRPDAVILGTGSTPVSPGIAGLDGDNVVEARELLLGRAEVHGPAVVLGGGLVGLETADYLVSRGIDVTVLEMLDESPVSMQNAHDWCVHQRLCESGCRILLGANVKRIEPAAVVFEQGGKEQRIESIVLVVNALGAASEVGLKTILEELGIEHRVVGDAKEPRKLIDAVQEGHQAGLDV